MNRKIYYWKLRSVELQLGEKTLIMGILNVTPDSFSDGGQYSDPDRAYARALELEEQGADIIDIGGESTSPGSQRVSAEEEWRRLAPVLKRLKDKLTIPISLDTYKAETAERALEYGIEIINDPSGLTFDADLAKTVANANAGLILNHMRGTPETWAKLPPLPDMIGSVARDLEATINRARRAGVDRTRIAVDPGLGFGKRREQNSEILAHLRQLAALDYPVLIGPSRKSFLAQAISAETGDSETLYATAAAVAISIMNGAHIVRVHDVKEMRAVVQITDEVVRASDVKEAKQAAVAAAAERPVPRRNMRDLDERPRSLTPPMAKAAPRPQKPVEAEVEAEPVETAAELDEKDFEAVEIVWAPGGGQGDAEAEADELTVSEEQAEEPRRDVRKEVRKETRPAAKPYGDRPLRRDFGSKAPSGKPPSSRPPSGKPFSDRRPSARRDSGDGPPRREFSERPPRREFGSKAPTGDRPPRREYSSDRPPSGDRPPRRDFGTSRPPSGDRPPRREFGASRPPRSDGGPPRRDFGSSRPPSGDRPPRKDFGDKPPRRDFGSKPSRGDGGSSGPPRRDFGSSGPPRRDSGGPPRGKGPGSGGSRPPSRPFRKRP
jgi:dihydropteroate synthase